VISKRTTAEAAKLRIMDAAIRVLTTEPGSAATIDRIAEAAGCAKGLVHYHFKTKDALLATVAARLWSDRAQGWREALSKREPSEALDTAWSLLIAESADGRLAASASLGLSRSDLAGRAVKEGRAGLQRALTDGVVHLFEHMARTAAVPPTELAALLAALIDGLGLQLASGERPEQLEPAWAAFWAAVMSLTRPA
jgi:TetR/AcrR family transcriptional repressor of bet genes